MKVFLPLEAPTLYPAITTALDAIGVDYTFNVSDDVDHTIHTRELFSNLDDLISTYPAIKSQFGGDVVAYVRDRNGLPPANNLAYKNVISSTLASLNLPHIETIYPTTLQQIEDFFDEHGSVFCKPVYNDGTRYFSAANAATLRPITYRKFSSYEEFLSVADTESLLSIQNSNNVLLYDKVIFQKYYDNDTLRTVWVSGFVNGTQDFVFSSLNDPVGPTAVLEGNRPNGTFINGLSPDHLPDSDADIVAAILSGVRDPTQFNIDKYVENNVIKQACNAADVKNTFFTAQLFLKDGEAIIYDFSTRIAPTFSRIHTELLEDYIKFIFDVQPEITMSPTKYTFSTKLYSTAPFDAARIAELKSHGIMPAYVKSGASVGVFIMVGTSAQYIADKYMAYRSGSI
jgi:hypothetical protein